MSIQRIRWSKVYESSEEELLAFLEDRGIQASRFVGEEYSDLTDQTSERDITIWCAEGSLSLRSGSTSTSLQPGDAVRISAKTPYGLHAGISGFVCYLSS
jgi:quercetin dioxygenase-like cupin family protein